MGFLDNFLVEYCMHVGKLKYLVASVRGSSAYEYELLLVSVLSVEKVDNFFMIFH